MELSLKGKVAVVTGGTRGIGYAVVKKFLEAGASVALCGSKPATANAALGKLLFELHEAKILAIAPDLTDSSSVENAFNEVLARFGRFDILVNNAGISQALPLNDYTDEEMDRILDINLKAVFVCCRAAARLMEADGGGVILNTSSVVSLYGQPSGCLYPTTKFAVNGLDEIPFTGVGSPWYKGQCRGSGRDPHRHGRKPSGGHDKASCGAHSYRQGR